MPSFPFERHDAEAGTFSGIASKFNTPVDDYYNTRIMPGAFAKTLNNPTERRRVKILLQHQTGSVIGLPTVLEERAEGLYIEGAIADTDDGKKAMQQLRAGLLDELSIGFDPVRWETVDVGGEQERHMYEVRLWEVSLVTFGANPEARVTVVHAANALPEHCRALALPVLEQLMRHPGSEPIVAALLQALAIDELHEGKTLSAKNKKLVKNAVAALKALLDAAGGDEDEAAGLVGECYGAATLDLLALEHDLALCQ